jgi:hypothetical protein
MRSLDMLNSQKYLSQSDLLKFEEAWRQTVSHNFCVHWGGKCPVLIFKLFAIASIRRYDYQMTSFNVLITHLPMTQNKSYIVNTECPKSPDAVLRGYISGTPGTTKWHRCQKMHLILKFCLVFIKISNILLFFQVMADLRRKNLNPIFALSQWFR